MREIAFWLQSFRIWHAWFLRPAGADDQFLRSMGVFVRIIRSTSGDKPIMRKIKLLAALAISAAMFVGMGSNAQSSFAASGLTAPTSIGGSGLVAQAIAVAAAHPCHARKCVYKV